MCVKVYIYISLFWKYYCKCGVLGKQFFFFFCFESITYFDITFGVGQAQPPKNVKKKYDTHCTVRLIHLYSPSWCCSVQTHGYTFLDLHKQTDRLYKLLDDQKNHTNRDQSLTLTIYFLHYHLDCRGCVISHARAVSIANLVMIRKGSSQLTFTIFFCLYTCIYIYIYIHFFKLTLCSNISSEIAFDNFSLHSHQLPY